ncbi:MAG: hypothetical protein AB8G99_20990 [Planctomycetaceae bacterium]
MIRYFRIGTGLLFLLFCPDAFGFQQETKPDPETVRFVGIAKKAVEESQSVSVATLKQHAREAARDTNTPKSTCDKVCLQIPKILDAFTRERALAWRKANDIGKVYRECRSLQNSAMLVELSKSYSQMLSRHLTGPQQDAWMQRLDTHHQAERERLDRLQKIAHLRDDQRVAEDAVSSIRSSFASELRRNELFRGALFESAIQTQARSTWLAQRFIEAEQKRIKRHYHAVLELIDNECRLSKQQHRRLLLAIKGVASELCQSRHNLAFAVRDSSKPMATEEFLKRMGTILYGEGRYEIVREVIVREINQPETPQPKPNRWESALAQVLTPEQKRIWKPFSLEMKKQR